MLQRADLAIIERDSALTGLELLLDAERLHAALAAALGNDGLPEPVVEYLRYKPGQSCLSACRLVESGRDVWFAAKAYSRGATDKVQKWFARPAVDGPLGPGRFGIGQGVVVSVFPNDRRLRALARLDAATLHARLARERRIGSAPSGQAVRLETLRYNPERRFVGRLTEGGRGVATIRCYRSADFDRTAGKPDALASRGLLRLPRVLMRVPRRGLVAMEWLDGTLLRDALRSRAPLRDSMFAVGVALAELHRQEPAALPVETRRTDVEALYALADDIACLSPELAGRARSVVDRLAGPLAAARNVARPVHGDFHSRQVLLQREGVAFLDLDEVHRGDPATDLGRLRADLERGVLYDEIDAERARSAMEALLEGYRRITGGLPRYLNLYAAAHLVRLAAHPFRHRELDWLQRTVSLLALAESHLSGGTRSEHPRAAESAPAALREGGGRHPIPASAQAVSAHAGARHRPTAQAPFDAAAGDGHMPFLEDALNAAVMSDHFTQALAQADEIERATVRRISVLRHKPGRRCVIEYVLDTEGSSSRRTIALIGKCRARGADAATHGLMRQLWCGPFGPSADDGIFVPEPVCTLPALHMTVQRRVSGPTLWSSLAGPDGVAVAQRAADAIAKLHRLSPPARRRHSVDTELAILQQRLGSVARVHPTWQQRIDALLDACRRLGRALDTARTCGIHRDFYPDQLLSDGTHLWLNDFDLYSEGDPALDVGNFAAHLDEYAIRHFGALERWADRRNAFIDRYLELSPHVTRLAIETYADLSLCRHIAISTQFPDRRASTTALIRVCEERLRRTSFAR